jgi:hypothetical protein
MAHLPTAGKRRQAEGKIVFGSTPNLVVKYAVKK